MQEVIVGVSSYYVARNPSTLSCLGLGSCLAIALHDPVRHIGGLSHAMLPNYNEGKDKKNPSKYVDTSIYIMVDEIVSLGGKRSSLKAKIVGGAQMFTFISPDTMDIGKRNIQVAKETFKKERIPLIAKEIGGRRGRTIHFDLKTGKIEVKVQGLEPKVI